MSNYDKDMKKYIWIVASILYVGVSFGQNMNTGQDNLFQTGEQIKTVTQAIKGETINDLNFLGAKFCNDGLEPQKRTSQLQLQMQPGQKKEICMSFYNISPDKSLDIKFAFSATSTSKEGKIACDDDVTTKNEFSKLIDQTNNTGFIIPANSQVIKRVKIDIPSSYTGNTMYGCLSYKMNKEETMEPGQMFLFVYRKTAPIAITVTGEVYKLRRRDDINDIYTLNSSSILKTIIAILGLWIIITIIQISNKKEKPHKKK